MTTPAKPATKKTVKDDASRRRVLDRHGIACSMSRVAQCWDNAPVESFFASLKRELSHHEKYTTHDEARASLFEYIEAFYNRVRLAACEVTSPAAGDATNPRSTDILAWLKSL